MRGNAVRQLEEGAQPGQLAATVESDIVPALGAGGDGADRDHQDVGQMMLDLAAARIRNRPEMSHQPLDGHDLLPHLKEGRSSPARQSIGDRLSCVAPGYRKNTNMMAKIVPPPYNDRQDLPPGS